MAKFCSSCGKEVNENAVVCLGCGAAVNVSQAPAYQQGYPQYGPRQTSPLVLQELSGKVKTHGIIWIIVAGIQYLLGLFFLYAGSEMFDGEVYLIQGGLLLGIAVINTILSVKSFSYSKLLIDHPIDIVSKYKPVGGCVGMLIYNIFFGGLVGIVGAIYAFNVRGYVIRNEPELRLLEQQYRQQPQAPLR